MFSHRSEKRKRKQFKGKSKRKGASVTLKRGPKPITGALGRDGEGRRRRMNHAKQIRDQKRSEVIERRRRRDVAPKIVALVSLSPTVDLRRIRTGLLNTCGVPGSEQFEGVIPAKYRFGKSEHSFRFYETPRSLEPLLDIAKVADILLFVFDPSAVDRDDVDQAEQDATMKHLDALTMLGMPTPIGVVQDSLYETLTPKRRQENVKAATDVLKERFSKKIKVVSLESEQGYTNTLRFLCTEALQDIEWREERAHLLAEGVEFVPNPDNAELGTLSIRGYIRGKRHLNPNRLVNITPDTPGSFQVSHIDILSADSAIQREAQRFAEKQRRKSLASNASSSSSAVNAAAMDDEEEAKAPNAAEGTVLETIRADPEKRESLRALMDVDTLANEQSIITAEELRIAERERHRADLAAKGLTDIEQRWNEALGWTNEEDGDDDDASMNDGSAAGLRAGDVTETSEDRAELLRGLMGSDAADTPTTTEGGSKGVATVSDLAALDADRPKVKFEIANRDKEDKDFPDEVDTPVHQAARVRFARYRGLKSFRDSPWHKHEQLPVDQGRVVQFENMRDILKDVASERFDGVAPRTHVNVHLVNVSREQAKSLHDAHTRGTSPVVLSGLFVHEHLVSLLHFEVKRYSQLTDDDVVAGKDAYVFHCGFRRFVGKPLFSLPSPGCDKQRVDKTLRSGEFVNASIYGQVNLGRCPVIMTRASPSSSKEDDAGMDDAAEEERKGEDDTTPKPTKSVEGDVVAHGKFVSVDPDRLLVKRILLTGYPIRCHKRRAVVRYMFFRPLDIVHFKPVALHTKSGLTGHIEESVGTHGYMKCMFSGYIKGNDIVCMPLYKRQYPPFPLEDFQKIHRPE